MSSKITIFNNVYNYIVIFLLKLLTFTLDKVIVQGQGWVGYVIMSETK